MATKTPIVRQVSWRTVLPVLVVIAAAMLVGMRFLGTAGIIVGGAASPAYSIGARLLISRSHRQGIALVKQQKFADAISLFEDSLDFFERHSWVDRFRPVVLLSASAFEYREMALLNIAFCYSQIGDGRQARCNYQECLRRYPDNRIAVAALRVLDAGATAAAD